MGIITQGILGGFSGKVGPVVGGKWKDVDYMRSYVIPANPNTTGQQTVRAKFAQLVATARALLSNLLQPYWDLFYSNMSGFNAWISQNYDLADSAGVIDETAVMSKGTLAPGSAPTTPTYNASTGAVEMAIGTGLGGNGLATDYIGVIAWSIANEEFYFDFGSSQRSDGSGSVTLPPSLTSAEIYCWTFLYRGTGSELIVSDSQSGVCEDV